MEKINIAELLKDCPQGMELDCTMYENVELDYIEQSPESKYPIHCLMKTNGGYTALVFTYNGCNDRHPNAKCVIFPKGKTTWEGFVSPCKFKDGDVLVHTQNQRFVISIYHKRVTEITIKTHCVLWDINEKLSVNMDIFCYPDKTRLATEEEKAKLFKAIKENGYNWNPETKTLEKLVQPKFKIGNIIRNKETKKRRTVTKIHQNCYECDDRYVLEFKNQDYWEIVPNKFDISTLIPFESRVLVRAADNQFWRPAIWGVKQKDWDFCCVVGGEMWEQCIPYECNEHLRGKTNDCDEYYKTWD